MPIDVGTQAPDFTLKDQNNQEVRLADFRGRKAVLLVFYPLAFTGTCQGELSEIRDNLADFYANDDGPGADGQRRLGVQPQGLGRCERVSSFPLLADFWPHGAVAQAYGVFNESGRLRQPRHLPDRPRRRGPLRRDARPGRVPRPGPAWRSSARRRLPS